VQLRRCQDLIIRVFRVCDFKSVNEGVDESWARYTGVAGKDDSRFGGIVDLEVAG
jgi:hypothetical protein